MKALSFKYASDWVKLATLSGGVLLFCAVAASAASPGERFIGPSPLLVLDAQPDAFATRLRLDEAAYARMKTASDFVLSDFALTAERRVGLELHRVEVFAPDARVVLGTAAGNVRLARPDVLLLAGNIATQPDSPVFLALSPHGSHGLIQLAGETFIVSSGPHGQARGTVVYSMDALPPEAIEWRNITCDADRLVIPGWQPPARASGASPRGGPPCRIGDVAIETDWEFTGSLFGGDTDASTAYAAALIGAVTEIYTRDLNVRLRIVFLRVWATSADPWNGGDTIDQLFQFQDYWNANMTGVQRHAAHFLSGRPLGGGVAYYPGLCYPQYDYALSANLSGYFPYPIQHNHSQNWDLMVVAHEFGHIFGGPHTHDMSPPVDNCAGGDCSVTPNGTIMSYCHLCPGGMTNIRMEFHDRVINEEMLPFLAGGAPCDLTSTGPAITGQPADQTGCVGNAATFTCTADGMSMTYQWRKDGFAIAGATDSSYTIDPVGPDDAGDYDVVVTGECGAATSDTAALTIAYPSAIDLDADCDVDLDDFSTFGECYNGSNRPPADTCPPGVDADYDDDGDCDLDDFSIFAAAYTGAL